jgi:hypothetical protein
VQLTVSRYKCMITNLLFLYNQFIDDTNLIIKDLDGKFASFSIRQNVPNISFFKMLIVIFFPFVLVILIRYHRN